MRNLVLASCLALAACASASSALTAPAAQLLYAGALGELQQAEAANPALAAEEATVKATAAPILSAIGAGATDAATATSLMDLANRVALDALPFVTVRPNAAAP